MFIIGGISTYCGCKFLFYEISDGKISATKNSFFALGFTLHYVFSGSVFLKSLKGGDLKGEPKVMDLKGTGHLDSTVDQ